MERQMRMLLSRDDSLHQRGYWVVASILNKAGIEVVLGGMQIPREIVQTAIQEDVDIIGYHIMQGAPKILVPRLFEIMKEKGIADTIVVVGGIIPAKDEALIRHLGVKEVFHPLTPMETIVEIIQHLAHVNRIGKSKTSTLI